MLSIWTSLKFHCLVKSLTIIALASPCQLLPLTVNARLHRVTRDRECTSFVWKPVYPCC